MRSSTLVAVLLFAFVFAGTVAAKEAGTPAQPGDTITWTDTLEKAFEKAASLKRPVMICINSVRVDGGKVEPAAKGLREVVYKDPRIVGKSREFVCVFLTSAGSSGDYGELRHRFGIDGLIVSPQHIFAHPEHKPGAKPLERKEYWPYGKGDAAVKALLGMMDKALATYKVQAGMPTTPETPQGNQEPAPAPEAPQAPDGDDARKAWIEKLIKLVKGGTQNLRRESIRSLVTNDKDGDCTTPLIALLTELDGDKSQLPVIVDIVRGLGRPGLDAAAMKINGYLKHKDEGLRANAAVTLEYIGCKESVAPLLARAKREKNETIANHMYRALGRCGVGESKVRAVLLKKAGGGKNETSVYGPIVGIAYFHGDAKAARGVEKLLKKIGPGGGRRGGWGNTMRRGMLAWALSEIGDPKSAQFMTETMAEPLEKSPSRWSGPALTYYRAVAKACTGDEGAKDDVDGGVRRAIEWGGGTSEIRDDARKDRDTSAFTPKADWDIEGRTWGGGRGGGGDNGGR